MIAGERLWPRGFANVQLSVLIDTYNHERLIETAVTSVLEQDFPASECEVIVVDDGSVDHSREVIATYGNRITPLLKANGGQNSALNAGFTISRGEVIIFLDSDDVLLPTAVENAVRCLDDPTAAKVHWRLWLIDENSRRSKEFWPPGSLTEGYFRDAIIREGPFAANVSSPTSGNAWRCHWESRAS